MNQSIPIYYETFGNPKNPCIVLIMGIGGQLIHWPTKFTEGLVDKGFYVVTFDNRDSGLSYYFDDRIVNITDAFQAKQQNKPFNAPYTLEDMADDVILLLDSLSIKKAHIAGISMGGMIAQILALNYPERLLSLICIATSSGDPHLPPPMPLVAKFFSSPQKTIEDLTSYVLNRTEIYKIYTYPDYFDEEKVQALHTKAYQRAYHPQGFVRQLIAVIFAEPRGEKLKHLKIKTLIIHGDNDPVFPIEHGKYLASCIQNSELKIVAKMGHALPDYLCEKLVNIIADFIKQKTGNADSR